MVIERRWGREREPAKGNSERERERALKRGGRKKER